MEVFIFVLGIVWIIFPFVVINFVGKQKATNRLIVNQLEMIGREMHEMNMRLEAANRMHGDLNRAAQWLIDSESGKQ